jgi:hypothetical protein
MVGGQNIGRESSMKETRPIGESDDDTTKAAENRGRVIRACAARSARR